VNPDLDLSLDRVIRAPRDAVWNAWTDPASLAQWWLPTPTSCRVDRLDVGPGGAFVTSMSDDGIDFVPHLDACFLAVEMVSGSCSRTPLTAAGVPPRPSRR